MSINRKREWKPKLPICKFCGAVGQHYSWQCPKKPDRKPMRRESVKARTKRIETAVTWHKLNPPNEYGLWECYLQIAPNCPIWLTRETLTLEHVEAKVRNISRKYDHTNIRSACEFCNKLKGSWSLAELAETYPRIRELLASEDSKTVDNH